MKKDSVMAWGSFIGHFAWYHIIFYNFTNSPLTIFVERVEAANPETVLTLFVVSSCLAIFAVLLVVKDRDLHANRPLWIFIHVAILVCVVLIPFITSLPLLYAFVIVCGWFSGIIFYRNLYSSLFHAPKFGWTRMLVVALFSFNIFVQLYALVPIESYPVLMYAVSVAVLSFGLVMSLSYKGNTLEVRKTLPDNKPAWRNVLPVLALFVGVSVCLSAYKSIALTVMVDSFEIAVGQAIACNVSCIVLFALGDRLGQGGYLTLFLVLLTAALISLQLLGPGGYMVVEAFIQPAYICWNVLLFSYLRTLFHQYGKNRLRLRFAVIIFFLLIVLPEIVARPFFTRLLAGGMEWIAFLYSIVVGLVLLIPQIVRVLTISSQDPSEDETSADFVPLPDDMLPHNIGDALAELLALISPAEHLTARETDVFKLLLGRQDVDVIAYILGIPLSTVRTHTKRICEKFGIRSKAELVNEQSSMMEELLSPEEVDVAMLLIEGETRYGISRKLHQPVAEVSRKLENIREKVIRRGNPDPGIAAAVREFKLTQRETDALRCLCQDMTNAAIAAELIISEETVRKHVRSLMAKLPVDDRREVPEWVAALGSKMK